MSSRKYKNEINLTTTMKTDIIQIADIQNVKEPVQVESIKARIEVQQCRLSVSYHTNVETAKRDRYGQ